MWREERWREMFSVALNYEGGVWRIRRARARLRVLGGVENDERFRQAPRMWRFDQCGAVDLGRPLKHKDVS